MKTCHKNPGPFKERPYYESMEIERICFDELCSVGLYPKEPSPIRIERFIEKRFCVTPRYDDLPEGILGLTKFGPKGVQEIVVNRALCEEEGITVERRINTTMAHEAGHGLLHTHLFLDKESHSLFENIDPKAPKILCREVSGLASKKKPGYDGRWWEFQANQVIGALLLPRPLAMRVLEPFLIFRGSFGKKTLNEKHRIEAIAKLVEIFDVNPIVADIRINELYPLAGEMQLDL